METSQLGSINRETLVQLRLFSNTLAGNFPSRSYKLCGNILTGVINCETLMQLRLVLFKVGEGKKLYQNVTGPCVGKGGEDYNKGEATMMSNVVSQTNESTGSSIVKESKEVSKIGNGRVIKASSSSGVSTKAYVGGLSESGEGVVLGDKAILGGKAGSFSSCVGKGDKGLDKGGLSKLVSNVIKPIDRVASLEDDESFY
ncbi:hypothetical protein QYF36_010508 [Acer negundo]|nr:hypothetical protein QYF36_010508 [Acer negundo]